MRRGTLAAVAVCAAVSLLCVEAASASSTVPNRLHVSALYAKDHHGVHPKTDADLMPYSVVFQKILSRCKIDSADLTNATLWMSGQASWPGAPPVSNLTMMQELTHHITWTTPKPCWDMFNVVQARMEAKSASTLIVNRHEATSLYIFDHHGRNPGSDVDIVTYSDQFKQILASCQINIDDLPTTMIELSEKASEVGGRYVSTLMMMKAVTRRVDWKGKAQCTATFDNAEGHMEAGGP